MNNENKILEFYKQFRKNRSALVGLYIVVILISCAIFAPVLAPYDPLIQNLDNRLIAPFWEEGGSFTHILGTDDFGRDLLSRIIYGARISLMIGVISVSISLFFGLIMGASAGYFGGKVDIIVMRIVDIMLSIPAILLAIVIVSILGPDLFNAMIAIGMKLELKNIFYKLKITATAILIKMFIIPILVLIAFQIFYNIDDTWSKTTILEVAMPPMTMAVVLAIKGGLDERLAINALVIGVLLSLLSISGFYYYLS